MGNSNAERQDPLTPGVDSSALTDPGLHFDERIEAVEGWAQVLGRLLDVGELKWAEVEADYRLLAINSALRRQLESTRAAVLLARQGLGHLAVAFVRSSLEDVMYLGFFVSLDVEDSQELFLLFGRWDAIRSVLAQRAYVGDEVMAQLWYPQSFPDRVESDRSETRARLKALQKKYAWIGGDLPSGSWIAEKAGCEDLDDFLHAASSRALHFSVGEIMRRGWGLPSGHLVTDKPEFCEHLAAFALDQLWRLYLKTVTVAAPFIASAGITSDDSLTSDELDVATDRLAKLGRVPLVHAAEWNLTPEGPLRLR